MKNTFKRTRIAAVAFLVAAMSIPFSGVFSGTAAGNWYIDFSDTAASATGGVELYKTVEATDKVNEWDVTLKVVSPKAYKTTDTVIVIDRSSSMASKLENTKKLVRAISTHLVANTPDNKVAVVTFAADGDLQYWGLTNDYASIPVSSISESSDGGAFTQQGLNKAVELLGSSSAEYRNIILISDSVPTYSYGMSQATVMNCRQEYGTDAYGRAFETIPHIKNCTFNNEPKGNGVQNRTYVGWNAPDGRVYYNHANAAIAAVKNFKTGANNTVAAISLNGTSTDGITVLQDIASDSNNYFTFDSSDYNTATQILNDVYEKKNNSSYPAAVDAEVTDEIATGFTVLPGGNYTVSGNEISWKPNLSCGDTNTTVCTDQVTYRVQIDDSIVNNTNADTNGFYELSNSAVMDYKFDGTAASGNFPVVKLNPVLITVKKTLEGKTCSGTDCDFDFELQSSEGTIGGTVKANDSVILARVLPKATFTVSELNAGYYKIDYSSDFTVYADGNDIEVNIKNIYETRDIEVKIDWQDDFDRDGKRPSEVEVELYGDTTRTEKINQAGDGSCGEWCVTFKDLPVWLNNSEINYTAGQTTAIFGYDTESAAGDMWSGFEIVNKHDVEVLDIDIQIEWDDENNEDNSRPTEVEVTLLADGVVDSPAIKVDEDGGLVTSVTESCGEWCIRFKDVYRNSAGVEISYSAKESFILGYTTNVTPSADKVVIKNSHTPGLPTPDPGIIDPTDPTEEGPTDPTEEEEGGKGGAVKPTNNNALSPETGARAAKGNEAAVENNVVMLTAAIVVAIVCALLYSRAKRDIIV